MTDTTLPPGRELDALIAERVMGWTETRIGWRKPGTNIPISLPYYSTSIADAWRVVEWVIWGQHGWTEGSISLGSGFELWYDKGWWCDLLNEGATCFSATSPAHAICLAALQAQDSEVDDGY